MKLAMVTRRAEIETSRMNSPPTKFWIVYGLNTASSAAADLAAIDLVLTIVWPKKLADSANSTKGKNTYTRFAITAGRPATVSNNVRSRYGDSAKFATYGALGLIDPPFM